MPSKESRPDGDAAPASPPTRYAVGGVGRCRRGEKNLPTAASARPGQLFAGATHQIFPLERGGDDAQVEVRLRVCPSPRIAGVAGVSSALVLRTFCAVVSPRTAPRIKTLKIIADK